MKRKKSSLIQSMIGYLYARRWKLVFIVGILFFIDFFSRLPYLGLLLTFTNRTILFWLFALFILRWPARSNFLLAAIVILFSLFSALRYRKEPEEVLGNIVYYLLVIGFSQYFWGYLKQIRKKREKK